MLEKLKDEVAKIGRQVLKTVKCRKLPYFAYIMRNEIKYALLQVILKGKIEDKEVQEEEGFLGLIRSGSE